MDVRWIIRVSALVAAIAAALVFFRWEDPSDLLGQNADATVRAEHEEARLLLRMGKLDEAIEVARGVVEREPRRAVTWTMLGTIYTQRGREGDAEAAQDAWTRALRLYERASRRDIDLIPRHALWYRMGWLYLRTGNEPAAKESLERAFQLHDALASRAQGELGSDFLYVRACFAALTGRREIALDAWEGAVRAGYTRLDIADSNPELDPIRDDPRFVRAREDALQRLEELGERRRAYRARLARQRAAYDGGVVPSGPDVPELDMGELCPRCGFDLEGSLFLRCPECGLERPRLPPPP